MKATTILAILVLVLALSTKVANADFTFGEPTNLGPTINSLTDDYFPNISVDGLTLEMANANSNKERTRRSNCSKHSNEASVG